jgi:hypothetical protein
VQTACHVESDASDPAVDMRVHLHRVVALAMFLRRSRSFCARAASSARRTIGGARHALPFAGASRSRLCGRATALFHPPPGCWRIPCSRRTATAFNDGGFHVGEEDSGRD